MPKFIVDSVANGLVTLRTPNNNYRNSFGIVGDATKVPDAGEPVVGTIRMTAWKADVVTAGGNYVEPLYGRPRRMQGTVLAVDEGSNELTLKTPYEVVVKLPAKYQAGAFAVGSRVGVDCVEVPGFEVG